MKLTTTNERSYKMFTSEKSVKFLKIGFPTVLFLSTTVFLFNTLWIGLAHWLWVFTRANWIMILSVVACITCFSIVGKRLYNYDNNKSSTILSIFGVILLFFAIFIGIFNNYHSYKNIYNASNITTVEQNGNNSFAERTPWEVAIAVSNASLGETTGNSTGIVKAIPGKDIYTTSVVRRGFVQGYESVQVMDLPLYGEANSNNVTFCNYSENANLRLGGFWFNNNLGMKILQKVNPNTVFNSSDAFAVCDGDTPMLYVPLKTQVGVFGGYKVSAGVAVYNGKTGELTIGKDFKNTGLQVYPLSLAEEQRVSLHSSGSFYDWLFGRSGYDNTVNDIEDPNGNNRSEIALKSSVNNNSYYVTPLTPRGSSTSIVALSTVNSSESTFGKLNEYVIEKITPARQANSTISNAITTNVLSSYKASGLTVFEIVPSLEGNWTASIGKSQSILYRANISKDGKIELTNAQGQVVYSDYKNSVVEEENSEKENLPLLDKPISEMSNEELLDFSNKLLELTSEVNDEWASRVSSD